MRDPRNEIQKTQEQDPPRRKRLQLGRETLRRLGEHELRSAAGGTTGRCPSWPCTLLKNCLQE